MSGSFPQHLEPYEMACMLDYLARREGHTFGSDTEIYHLPIPDQIFVIRDYMTGGPGYRGELYFVVWDGAPEYIETFTCGPEVECRVCHKSEFWHQRQVEDEHAFEERHVSLQERLTPGTSGTRIENLESVVRLLMEELTKRGIPIPEGAIE